MYISYAIGILLLAALFVFHLEAKTVFVGYVLTLATGLGVLCGLQGHIRSLVMLVIILLVVILVPSGHHHHKMAEWRMWAVAAAMLPSTAWAVGYCLGARRRRATGG